MELPRLSRALRAKTDLEIIRNLKLTNEERISLKLKRFRDSESESIISWHELKDFCKNSINDEKTISKINGYLNTLWNLTRDLIGKAKNEEIVNDTAVFVLKLFLKVRIVQMKHLAILKEMFGSILPQTVNKMCSAVCGISSLLNEECQTLLESISSDKIKGDQAIGACSTAFWGSKIVIRDNEYCADVREMRKLIDLSPNLALKSNAALRFSMRYKNQDGAESTSNRSSKDLFSRSWFAKHLDPELIDSLLEILKSKKTNDELQNVLFEFLGFDKFEIILEILQSRKEIIEKIKADTKNEYMKSIMAQKVKNRNTNQQQGPCIAPNFVVQSEQERQFFKQIRKDEKKLNRMITSAAKDIEDDVCEELNPVKLRLQQKQKFLAVVEIQPVLKDLGKKNKKAIHQPCRFKYPF